MPRSLAEGRTKLALFPTKPADLNALTAADLNDALDASCRILGSDYSVGAAASETVDERALCTDSNAQALGVSNYTFEITSFRYFTADGAAEEAAGGDDPDDVGDSVYQMLKTKGTTVWAAERFTSKKSREDWEAGDEYSWYEVLLDNPQASERTGYIKARHVGLVQDAGLDLKVAAGAGG